ncbi:Protein kinase, putative [Hondaea fermentalgiana]|uniref:Protein kinase, putative n=1 Tax=Hondaea fermentalgiana TaxID=2315210 RepID=A0A2R5H0N1_9STRA|nr:Protein kinase, putative [Hondaea fermentalgiana]|eukprot:GBG33874.1 Protein kinase, putative [Hondaea fermentalgiana]
MHVDLRDRVNHHLQLHLGIAHAQKMDKMRFFLDRVQRDDPVADQDAFRRDVDEGIRLSRSTGERGFNNMRVVNLFNGAGIAQGDTQLHIDAEILHFAGTERTGLFVDVVRKLGVPFRIPDFIIAPEAWSAAALATCRLIRNVQLSPRGPRFMADVGPRLDTLVGDGEEFLTFCNEDLTHVAEQVCASLGGDLDRLRQEVDAATARLNDRLGEGQPMYTEGLGTQMKDLLDAGSRLVEARTVLENAAWTNDPITKISPKAERVFRWPSREQYLNAMTDWDWMHPVIRALAAANMILKVLVTTGAGELIEVHPWEPHRARYVVHTAQNMGLRVIATVAGIGDFEIWSPTVGAEPGYPRSHWWAGGRCSIPYMLDMTLAPGFQKLGAPCPLDEAAIDSLKTALTAPLRRARHEAKEELLELVGPESQVSRIINVKVTVLEYIAKLRGAFVGEDLYASVKAVDRYVEALNAVEPDTLGAFPQVDEFCERARASLATLNDLIGASRGGIVMWSVETTVREVRQVQTLCNKIPNAASDPIGDVHEACAATRDMFRDCTAKEICRNEWSRANENGKLQLLGRSERSTVHAGILETETGLVPVAIKSTCIQDPDDLESLANEVSALLRVGDHPRLLGFYGYTLTRDLGGEERVVLILELGTTSLAASLEQAQESLTADAALYISWSVVEGVRRCHALGVVHQDIKAENVVMVDGRAKLADLGNASIRRMAATTRTMRRPVQAGFSALAAPEVLMKPDGYEQGHTRKSDAYSLGLLLLQIQLARGGVPLFGSKESGAPLPDCFVQVLGMYCAVQEDTFQLHPRIEAAMNQKGIDERVLPAIRTCLVERTLPALQRPSRALPE